jgi:hypothetical protein
MDKKSCTVLLAVILTVSYAQAQLYFGARAGLNLTNIDNELVDNKHKPSFQIGLVGEKVLGERFAGQLGILFYTQGCKNEQFNSTTNLNYIQLRLNPTYKARIGGMRLLLFVSTYCGYAIGGKINDQKIKFGGNNLWKAFDFGGGLGTGLQFDNIQVAFEYSRGFTNLFNIKDVSVKNNGLALTVTYLFGK